MVYLDGLSLLKSIHLYVLIYRIFFHVKTCDSDTFCFTIYFNINITIFPNWLIKLRNLISFRIIWIEIVLRSNLEFVAISIFKAIDARIAQSTRRLLTTGNTPGYAKSITFVFELGSLQNVPVMERTF